MEIQKYLYLYLIHSIYKSKLTDSSKILAKFSKTVSVKTNINFTTVITLLERKVNEKILKFTLLFCLFLYKVFKCLLRVFRKLF